jgi:hypothetical protein
MGFSEATTLEETKEDNYIIISSPTPNFASLLITAHRNVSFFASQRK